MLAYSRFKLLQLLLRAASFRTYARRRAFENPHYITTLFSGYSTMPSALAALSRGIISQAADLFNHGIYRHQPRSLRVAIVGPLQSRQHAKHCDQILLSDVQHQPDAILGLHRATQHHSQIFNLAALVVFLPGGLLAMICVFDSSSSIYDPQVIGAQGTAGFGDFDDGVRQHGRLYFRRSPGKLHLHIDVLD